MPSVRDAAPSYVPESRTAPLGRRPITTRAQISEAAINLFSEVGFEETSVDDIAEAVGIARRTLFRYYPSKNAIAWGDFDEQVDAMRALLAAIPPELPIAEALTHALVSFNDVPPDHLQSHRRRMTLLLGVPALQAHSMIMYADWRHAIADFCALRLHQDRTDHLPQTIAWLCLGTALAAYEQWLADPGADLRSLLIDGCATMADGLRALR
ncbi:MAG: mycofactocin system transcriptional regulator [Gordonia sp. (in: high G+C Gram-positive bacteria)]